MRDFTETRDYVEFEKPIELEGFTIIGYFPYRTACVRPEKLSDRQRLPRRVASYVEKALPATDNKITIICQADSAYLTEEDFAVFLHDSCCVFGRHEDVKTYSGYELPKK